MFNYMINEKYRQTYDIMHTEPKQWNVPRLVLQLFLVQSSEARSEVENENTAEAAPWGVVPTTSEWSTSLLPTKVRLLIKNWR